MESPFESSRSDTGISIFIVVLPCLLFNPLNWGAANTLPSDSSPKKKEKSNNNFEKQNFDKKIPENQNKKTRENDKNENLISQVKNKKNISKSDKKKLSSENNYVCTATCEISEKNFGILLQFTKICDTI